MKVAVVSPLVAPLSDAQAYGSHAVLIDLARGLSARGHDVRVFAAAGSILAGVSIEQIPTDEAVSRAFIRPRAVSPAAGGGDASRPNGDAVRRAFETLFARVRAWRPDAVSGHAFDAEAIELARGLPVAHTLHLPPIVPAVVDAARLAHDVVFVAVSRASQRDWEAAGVHPRLIPNGVADPFGPDWRPDPEAGRAAAVIAGRISPEKGTATAIGVARRAGLRPLVVGSDYDAQYAEREVRPLLRPGERMAPVTRAELARLMASAAVTLMPVEWDEPFGLVAAESGMAGCPVVAYRRGALPEIVVDGTGGYLVAPGDEEALVAACRRAASLDRAAIRRDALARLSIEPMLGGYERLLRALAL